MIVVEHKEEILCEYQIKIKDTSEDSALSQKRNKFNHLLYEFQRSETLQDLINALSFVTSNSGKAKQAQQLQAQRSEIENAAKKGLELVNNI
jgi:hypothetical protein